MSVYLIRGPALISFSGGRTSAYMLHQILQAHGGALPADVVVAFANTGKEREETLRFVHECGVRWGVQVRWVEWRDSADGFEEVGFNSASRKGEPFDALIDLKQRLPRGPERWCTEYLKVRAMFALMRALGHGEPGEYEEAIGLRYDEGLRILRGVARAEKDKRRVAYPLNRARATKRDVRAFWWGGSDARFETSAQPQGFDLQLPALWGNCDFCFAMGVGIREERARLSPETPLWWKAAEERQGGTFAMRESVADVIRTAEARRGMGDLFDPVELTDAELDDGECGSWCSPDQDAA